MGSFFEDFDKIFPQQQNEKGPLKLWAGTSVPTPDNSVMDQPIKIQPTAYQKREKEQAFEGAGLPTIGIGDLQFGISDFYTPGGFTKIAGAVGAKLAATPFLVGAFRSSDNTMLSRNFVEKLKNRRDSIIQNQEGYEDTRSRMIASIAEKVTPKEMGKYGTPEYSMDRFLLSTTDPEVHQPEKGIKYLTGSDVSSIEEARDLAEIEKNMKLYTGWRDQAIETDGPESDNVKNLNDMLQWYAGKQNTGKTAIEDLALGDSTNKAVLFPSVSNFSEVTYDFREGIMEMAAKAESIGLSPDDVQKKSLQQLTSIIGKKEDDALRLLKKNAELKDKAITSRTAALKAEQVGDDVLEDGFVRLTTDRDLAHETDVLNHCIGAVGRRDMKYIPMYDTVTGKQTPWGSSGVADSIEDTSIYNYINKLNTSMERGGSEYYSFRPDGKPTFTVEIGMQDYPRNTNLKEYYVKQQYGEKDRHLTESESKMVEGLIDKKNMQWAKANKQQRQTRDLLDPEDAARDDALMQRLNAQNAHDNAPDPAWDEAALDRLLQALNNEGAPANPVNPLGPDDLLDIMPF